MGANGHDDARLSRVESELSAKSFRGFVRLVLPSRIWLVGLAWPVTLAFALRILGAPFHSLVWTLIAWVSFGLVAPLILLRLAWSYVGVDEVYGELEVDPESIRFDGEPIALREDLIEGMLAPSARGKPARVEIKSRASRRPIRIIPASQSEAKRILEALELDARHRSLDYLAKSGAQGLSPFRRFHAGIAVILGITNLWLALSLRGIWALFAMPTILLAIVSVILLFIPTRIRIGADGVALHWLTWKRFVRVTEITRASRIVNIKNRALVVSVSIVLNTGEEIILPMGGPANERDALIVARRIEESVLAQRGRTKGARTSSVLRGGRSPLSWVSHLRTIGTGANVDMRNAPVTKEELFDLVEDAGVAPSARVGAAIALARVVNPYERKRIRIAGRSSASLELRSALETAADIEASEVELARTLVRVEGRRKVR